MEVENWKSIEDYPNYEVSSFGNVRNAKTSKLLKAGLGKNGYHVVTFSKKLEIRRLQLETLLVAKELVLIATIINGGQILE
eukprot:gene14678-19716_t